MRRRYTVEWATCDLCAEYAPCVQADEVRVLMPGAEHSVTPLVLCRRDVAEMAGAFALEGQADALLSAGNAAMQRARAA